MENKLFMETKYSKKIAHILALSEKSVIATLVLLEEGNTIPFISRYRKEATGDLDETQVLDIQKQYELLKEIDSRRKTILNEIEKQGSLTPQIKKSIEDANTLTVLEDIYLPYKPKRKTKASIAKEMGLEPLAKRIYGQQDFDIKKESLKYINKDVKNTDEAIEGAKHIIAEWINEDQRIRQEMRRIYEKEAVISSKLNKGMEEKGKKYKDYFDFSEPLKKISSHRFLAIRRAEKEKVIKASIKVKESSSLEIMQKILIRSDNDAAKLVEESIKDCCKRLLSPSIEKEFSSLAKIKADEEAIKVFADNLRQLLLAPYLGRKRVLAIDPGFRTGCKFICLNEQGDLLFHDVIFPNLKSAGKNQDIHKIRKAIRQFDIEVIAIGNGTASRETAQFIYSVVDTKKIKVFIVSESGASIYSASDVAREEFPDFDVTVRGAVSIGRRLMDPLAELVKIDPKSIGVGQYQHDVDQARLKDSLDFVVSSCVNMVGVNINTASKHLLTYVSGVGPKMAQNIIDFRKENGPFKSRKEFKMVPKLGEKIFEQCAGFLRIEDAENPLDASAVHPESYYVVEKISSDLGMDIHELIGKNIKYKINLHDYTDDKTGLLTLEDILEELSKPGRDPRENVDDFEFKKDVLSIDDLKVGMILQGIVNNITNFGAFVDIGIKEYGLIHISELSHKYVKDPHEIVKINQKVNIKIIDVDSDRKRISLSLKETV
jgi:protein Tex